MLDARDFVFYFLCHAEGEKNIRSGKISSLPASISKDKTNFEREEKFAKLYIGPTSPRPGPMLFKVAATAVKLVVRSNPSVRIMRREATKTKI